VILEAVPWRDLLSPCGRTDKRYSQNVPASAKLPVRSIDRVATNHLGFSAQFAAQPAALPITAAYAT
jgi:hypothetical protein